MSREELMAQLLSGGVPMSPQPVSVPAPGSPQNPNAAPLAPWPGTDLPRGIRNNNPGNVEYRSTDPWEGQIGTDGRFATFDTPEHGIRAMGRLMDNYQQRYGLNDLQGMLTRYAPPRENDTATYIRNVGQATGLRPNEPFSFTQDPERGRNMLRAMILQENGQNPYTDEQLRNGWDLAFPPMLAGQ